MVFSFQSWSNGIVDLLGIAFAMAMQPAVVTLVLANPILVGVAYEALTCVAGVGLCFTIAVLLHTILGSSSTILCQSSRRGALVFISCSLGDRL